MKHPPAASRTTRKSAAIAWGALLALCLCLTATPAQAQTAVRLSAHRGFTLHHPENSLGALAAAIDLGLDGAEVDLQTTKDGQLVLLHDGDLKRTSDCQGKVAEMAWAQVAQCRLRDKEGKPTQERVPSLAEALELVAGSPGFSLSLDLKGADLDQVADLVAAKGLTKRVQVYVPRPERLDMVQRLRERHPDIPVCMDLRWWWKIEGLPSFVVRALKPQYLFSMEWNASPAGFAAARQAGAQVVMYLWGLEGLAQRAKMAADMGATVISCDRPDLLLPVFRAAGQGGGTKTGGE